MNPPIYDPYGPVCVIDRVHGPDRQCLLELAMAAAARRGDAAVVVVSDDTELAEILHAADFRAEVDLFARL